MAGVDEEVVDFAVFETEELGPEEVLVWEGMVGGVVEDATELPALQISKLPGAQPVGAKCLPVVVEDSFERISGPEAVEGE